MAMVAEKHPEVRPLVAEYKRMTLVEKLRKRAEYREKQRRDEWAALEYVKDEVRAELGQIITEQTQALTEKDQALTEKDQALTEKDRAIWELERKLREAGIDPR
jgi:hypothetical protein